jgi:predicted TPR repeat methyltransferase
MPLEFIEIPPRFLASIATDSERVPRMYFQVGEVARRIFWLRLRWIHRLIQRHCASRERCLDFGAGGGVFLPSLSQLFDRVVSVDLEVKEALQVVEHYGLRNVRVVQADITRVELEEAPFDAIVAADVLEHFRELSPAVTALRRWLAPDGTLFTSLPSENWVYVLLRVFFGIEKPPDHYHTGFALEAYLESNGFRRVQRWFVPLRVRLVPLYLVSAWRRTA